MANPIFHKILRGGLVFLVITAFLASGPGIAAAQSPVMDDLEAFMDGVVTAELAANQVPGAVVVVVRDGEVALGKGYGYADVEQRIPVNAETTLFRPGSVSKLFTWTAVMQLVEQDRLSLDEDVNTYLDFSIPATFPEPITLRHLMTHTPGFEDKGENLFKLEASQLVSLEAYLKDNLPARVFPPGKFGAYSNYGTALAGYIVQRVSGMPYADYIEQNIFAPLGMTHATFRQPLPENLAGDMAEGYNYANGRYVKGSFEYVLGTPAGALSASGLDMAKFMVAHLQNGRYGDTRILQEATAKQMHSPLFSHDARLTGMAYGFFESRVNGEYVVSHGGDTILFHSSLTLLPERNVGLFISTNGTGGAKAVEGMVKAFYDRYFPAGEVNDPAVTQDFEQRAGLYAGEYFLARSNFTGIEKFLRLTTPVSVSVDTNQDVLVNAMGSVNRFVEVEPGLLVERGNPESRLVMKQEGGQVYLYPSSPFVFIKTPWYAQVSLTLTIMIGGALLFLGVLIGWGVGALRRLRDQTPRSLVERLAKWFAVLLGLDWLIFLVIFGSQMADVNPAFGVPNLFFEVPPVFGFLSVLTTLLAVFALGMLVSCVALWLKRVWSVKGRIGYSLLSLWALAMVWAMLYWNFLF